MRAESALYFGRCHVIFLLVSPSLASHQRKPFVHVPITRGLYNPPMTILRLVRSLCLALVFFFASLPLHAQDLTAPAPLPNGRLLGAVPGHPREINNLATAAALSPDGRFVVLLHSGFGSDTNQGKQSLSVLKLENDALSDFPEDRLGRHARQTYFLGLAFSLDGKHLYASMASYTDPLGKKEGSTGNGIAVYSFADGRIAPERFLPLSPRTSLPRGKVRREEFKDVTYPAGLSVGKVGGEERILVACNHSDETILLNPIDGKTVTRFDLSTYQRIPASLPYTTVITSDGTRGFVSLWNASTVVELDLLKGKTVRRIELGKPRAALAGGSHPTAMLLNRDSSVLFVALTNRDQIVALDTKTGKTIYKLSTKLTDQAYGGSDPQSLALSPDETTLFSANAISDSVAVFDLSAVKLGQTNLARGFIPTEWYPTVVAATAKDLLIASAKGHGSGPNSKSIGTRKDGRPEFPYVLGMLKGSLARLPLAELSAELPSYSSQVAARNASRGNTDRIPFAGGANKIRHVIYIIKENRTYDQIFGDLGVGDSDPSVTMYGADITPNQHALARQFGVLDNFYDSGDVSGDGHVWSTSASVSDYIAKTIPVGYRGREHTYDSEGEFLEGISAEDGLPDAGEPTGGYLWKNFATHGVSYRHYGEYIVSRWCNAKSENGSPTAGPPKVAGVQCRRTVIKKGEPLEKNVGEPHGHPSPYAWDIPVLARNIAAESELRGHFDPLFPDFEVAYPDQLRVDEFLNEFNNFVASRSAGKDEMPQFILLRLPNDHTAGLNKGKPTPSASLADNDLAVGRVVDAISHGPYWDDTAFLILEDDAQDGPDHVDSHRSIALVISKYAPISKDGAGNIAPFVDHNFYTTINVVRTIEALLGVPPMNSNDARAAVMAPLFSGAGTQPAFSADYRNRDNGLIYRQNEKDWQEGKNMDFSHADAVDTALLNQFLWQDIMGNTAMPASQHHIFPATEQAKAGRKSKERDLD
jgi:DNA-binding beta-propeller fold protein YncE